MISKEELGAYVDGELDPADAGRVEAALQDDADLRAALSALNAQKNLLAERYDAVLQEPAPARLEQLLSDADANQAPFTQAKSRLISSLEALANTLFATRWRGGLTAAACLLVGVFAGGQIFRAPIPTGYVEEEGALFAQGDLVQVLSTDVSGEMVSDITPVLSFLTRDETLCRAFVSLTGSGVACLTSDGWRIEALSLQTIDQGEAFRTASSALPIPVLEAVDRLMDGDVLDADAERRALQLSANR